MAEFTYFGTETGLCPDPGAWGCEHALSIHGYRTDGCSWLGSSGWCDCNYVPERDGAAALLAESVPIGTITPAPGPSLGPGLIPASKVFSHPQTPATYTIACKALVKVSALAYRPCRKAAEFTQWVRLPGAGPSHTHSQRQMYLCFTHNKTKEVFFEV